MAHKFTWHLLFLPLIIFSCATHKNQNYKTHIPPSKPVSQIKNTGIFYPQPRTSNKRKIIVQNAIKNLGRPYKWAGRSPHTGFDCSGLIVYIYQMAGIILPRTAKAQFRAGRPVSKINLQPGDLIFFKPPGKQKIFHVSIYVGDGRFIHAPGKGRKVTYGYLGNPYFKKYYSGSRSYL